MPVPSLVTDLSTTAASNSPAGSDNVFPDLDNYLRAMSAFIASIRDNSGNGWVSPYLPLAGGTVTGATTFSNTVTGTKFIPTGTSATGNGMYLPATNTLGFSTNGTQAMTLDASGNLKLTSGGQVEVNVGSLSSKGAISAFNTDSTNGGLVFKTEASGTLGERARITSAGDLLVGATSSDGYRLKTEGSYPFLAKGTGGASLTSMSLWNDATTGDNIFVVFSTETGGTTRGAINYNRTGALVNYGTTSDYRAKDIIGPVQNSGATIDALKVYEGVMKGATQSRPMLIAHEAQAHAPYAVSGVKDEVNEDGTPKYQQIDVSSLVPLLLAEIQSLRARVAALEAA